MKPFARTINNVSRLVIQRGEYVTLSGETNVNMIAYKFSLLAYEALVLSSNKIHEQAIFMQHHISASEKVGDDLIMAVTVEGWTATNVTFTIANRLYRNLLAGLAMEYSRFYASDQSPGSI